MLKAIRKRIQKIANYNAFLSEEMNAADFVSRHIPPVFETWQALGIEIAGQAAWDHFIHRPVFFGYLYAWCDLLAMAAGAEQGGNGSVNGYLKVLRLLLAEADADKAFQATEYLLSSKDEEILEGGKAGAADYNLFATGKSKAPIYLAHIVKSMKDFAEGRT